MENREAPVKAERASSPDYGLMTEQLRSLAEISRAEMPLLSNAAAILYEALPQVNWAGFYLVREGSLLLGPFQGKAACVRIERGHGVCGTAWERDEILRVEDVHAFPGHIACDAASRSEIVLPLHGRGRVVGVLDIDSPETARFTREDQEGLSAFAEALEGLADWAE